MWFIAASVAALSGTALHFLYDVFPNVFTALISPVNESVWEHLKLLFWPMLAAAFVLARRSGQSTRIWGAFFAALLAAPALLLGLYYTLKYFGIVSLALDISLYYICMFFGFFLARQLSKTGCLDRIAGYLLVPVFLYGASLILFTFAAPQLPIFREPSPCCAIFF